MGKISRSFKIEKGILDGMAQIATRENRTNNNFVETALAVVVAVLKANPELQLTDLMGGDPVVIKTFKRLFSDT